MSEHTIDTIVIAAAGRGTRMEHLAQNKPKHLISVAGKPFFHHLLKMVDAAGFKKIVVVIGHMAEQMEAFLEQQPYDITIVNQNEYESDRYGTAIVVEAVQDAVGNNPFVFINGDSLYTPEVLQAVMHNDGMNRIVGTHHPDPKHYGVLESEEGMLLKRVVEKPDEPICNVINLGIYTFQPAVFDAIKKVELSQRGEYEIVDAINVLAQDKQVEIEQLQGEWVDFGRPTDVPKVEEFLRRYSV